MAMTIYKLTDQDMRTYNGFQYTLGVEARATGEGTRLCSHDLLHFYLSPEIAVLLNPIHAGIKNPRLFRAETPDVPVMDGQRKGGVKRMTLVEEMALPTMSLEQRMQVAIALAWGQTGAGDPWRLWALAWLRGQDRTRAAAADAATYATAAYAVNAAAADLLTELPRILAESPAATADRLEGLR